MLAQILILVLAWQFIFGMKEAREFDRWLEEQHKKHRELSKEIDRTIEESKRNRELARQSMELTRQSMEQAARLGAWRKSLGK